MKSYSVTSRLIALAILPPAHDGRLDRRRPGVVSGIGAEQAEVEHRHPGPERLPEVAARFEDWLMDTDLAWRAEVIVLVGRRGLARFAPLLNDALDGNADDLCRAYAITAAEELRAEANLPDLLRLAGDPALAPLFRRLLPALTAYADPRCRAALKRFFRPDQPKEVRVFAAWGLGKLGDEEAIRYLAEMLDDPAVRTPTSYDPGESMRAAQALCDVRVWPFEWSREGVDRTRRRWLRSLE